MSHGYDSRGFTTALTQTKQYHDIVERERQAAKLAGQAVKVRSSSSKQKYWMGFRRDPKFEAAVKRYTPVAIRGAGTAAGLLVGGAAGVGIAEGARVVSRLSEGKSLRQSLPSKKEIATTIALAGLAKYGPGLARKAVGALRGAKSAYSYAPRNIPAGLGKRRAPGIYAGANKVRRINLGVAGNAYDDAVMKSARAAKRAGSALRRLPVAKRLKYSSSKALRLTDEWLNSGPIKRRRFYDAEIFTSDYAPRIRPSGRWRARL